MPNAEARRTMPGPLEVVEIERSFLREVGSIFWFIANTFQETMERVQQGRAPFRAASFFRESVRAGVDSVPLVGLVCFFLGLTMALLTGYQLQRCGTERLMPGTDCEGRRRWGRHQHDFQRGHRYHNRDRFRHGLQYHLHQLLSDVSTSSDMVELRGVHMKFEDKNVLEGVTLNVQPQERLVIMGQSGSGKSTILRLILGILRPDSGSIFFKQFEINRLKRRKLQQVRGHIGMVYQYSALLSSLTVRENVALPLDELTDKSRDEIDNIVDEKLELVGMQDTKDLLPDELSGGMRKRVALARGLVLDPELILLDEPSAGLDPVIATVVDELIISLTEKSKVTSITVTYEMESAFRIATRMAMLYEGKIIEEGEPEKFKQSKNPVVAQFLSGSTEGPILEGTLDAIRKK